PGGDRRQRPRRRGGLDQLAGRGRERVGPLRLRGRRHHRRDRPGAAGGLDRLRPPAPRRRGRGADPRRGRGDGRRRRGPGLRRRAAARRRPGTGRHRTGGRAGHRRARPRRGRTDAGRGGRGSRHGPAHGPDPGHGGEPMTRPISRRPTRRHLFLGAGGLLTGGILAACSSEPEAPPAPPEGPSLAAPTPVTTTAQFEGFVTGVHEAVVAADEARDASLLAPRVSGSAAEFRTAAYEMIAEVEEWAEELMVPGSELIVPMTSTGVEFPRVAIALVSDSVEDGVPYFMALRQADARSA